MVSNTTNSEPQTGSDENSQPRPVSLGYSPTSPPEDVPDEYVCRACGCGFDTAVERDHHTFHCDNQLEMLTANANSEAIERALVDARRAARSEY